MIYLLASAIIFLLLLLGFVLWRLFRSQKENEGLAERYGVLEMKVHNIQLDQVESRLNPHLFKNILNSIQSHAYQTYFAIDKLASVLDYIIYESKKKHVSAKEEIEFALNFIEINKIKLSPLFELKVKSLIDEDEKLYTQELLAPLISVDLIENAFKHADLQSPDAFISVVFELKDGYFQLIVSNKISDKKAMKKERSGIGSVTLDHRLKIIYKSHYLLERFSEDDVYTAHLKINLRGYKAQVHTA